MSSVICTDRLMLVAATIALCDAEYEGAMSVGRVLGATMPASWPPAVFERDDVDRVRQALWSDPETQGWTLHYLLRRPRAQGDDVALVGIAGFASRPTAEGLVEIGYAIAEEHRRRGYATEAVEALLARAFADTRVRVVTASTYASLAPSIGVLKKTGFEQVSCDPDTGLVRFRRVRDSDQNRYASETKHSSR